MDNNFISPVNRVIKTGTLPAPYGQAMSELKSYDMNSSCGLVGLYNKTTQTYGDYRPPMVSRYTLGYTQAKTNFGYPLHCPYSHDFQVSAVAVFPPLIKRWTGARYAMTPLCGHVYNSPTRHERIVSGYVSVRQFTESLPTIEFDRNQMVIDLLNKIKDQGATLIQSYLERMGTYNQLADIVMTIVKSARDFRRGRWDKAMKRLKNPFVPKNLHNTWLGYRYGLTPTMLDAQGIGEQAAKAVIEEPMIFICSLRQSQSSTTNVYCGYDHVPPSWEGGTRWYGSAGTVLRSADSHVIMSATCEVTNPNFRTATQWGLVDPLSIAWEMTPLSFVANWFIDIGGYLSALTALNGINIISASETFFTKATYTGSLTAEDVVVELSPGTRIVQKRQMIDLSSVPLPSFGTRGNELIHLVDACALLKSIRH